MANVHTASSRVSWWYQKWSRRPHGLGGLWHGHIQTNNTNTYLNIWIPKVPFASVWFMVFFEPWGYINKSFFCCRKQLLGCQCICFAIFLNTTITEIMSVQAKGLHVAHRGTRRIKWSIFVGRHGLLLLLDLELTNVAPIWSLGLVCAFWLKSLSVAQDT